MNCAQRSDLEKALREAVEEYDKSLADRATVENQSGLMTWTHHDLNKPVDAAMEAKRAASVALGDHIKLCGCSPSDGQANTHWYLYRVGSEIKLAHLDQDGALALHEKGHELGSRPYATREEAEIEQISWQQRLSAVI